MQNICSILDITEECDDEYLLDIYIAEKISKIDNPVNYFSECFGKEQSLTNCISFKFFENYILIDNEGNTIQTVIHNINDYNLHFISYFFRYLVTKKNNNLINDFKSNYIKIPYQDRLPKLQILFKDKYIRDNMFREFYNDGRTNEMKGYLVLFNDIISDGWNINIEPIKPILNLFVDDEESCSKFVNLIYKHIHINKAFSHLQPTFNAIKKCSSAKYTNFLVKIMLYIFDNIIKDNIIKDNIIKDNIIKDNIIKDNIIEDTRLEYELKDNDNLITRIIITTLYALKIGYIPLAKMYHSIQREVNLIEEDFLMSDLTDENFLIQKESIEIQYSRITSLYKDMAYHSLVAEFIDIICLHNILISNEVSHDFHDFIFNSIVDHKVDVLPINIIHYLLKAIRGDYDINKHERYAACTTLNAIYENKGPYFFNNIITIASDIFISLVKFLITVDHFEWTHPKYAQPFYQNVLNILSYYSKNINTNTITENIRKDINLLLHKITSRMNTLITNMEELCKKINEETSLNTTMMRHGLKSVIEEYIKTFMVCIQTLQSLIRFKILEVEKLPIELILPLSSFTIAFLTLLADGKNPLYTIFHMNMETLDLMQQMFELINLGCSNDDFTENIKNNINIVKEMVNNVKLNKDLKDSLIKYLGNLNKTDNNTIDLPDEFTDPILATEIKNPVMIPKIDKIFDRSSIMSHLYSDETNPFTREKLTIHDFEEYNEKADVKCKISDFVKKYLEYKNKNKQ